MEHHRRILTIFVLYLVPLGVVAVFQTQNSTRSSKFFLFRVVPIAPEVCNTTSKDFGVCVTKRGCRKGTIIGSCAGGYGACCRFQATCGDSVKKNGTSFVNPDKHSDTCKLDIPKLPKTNICQVQLKFLELDLKGPDIVEPSAGSPGYKVSSCKDEHLEITGISTMGSNNKLCGKLSGQHLYADFGNLDTITMRLFLGSEKKSWNILVTYIPCNSPVRAPPGCLQYYTGVTGTVRSFNYEDKGQHLHDQDIVTCIRSEKGMKSIKWTSCSMEEQAAFYKCTKKKANDQDMDEVTDFDEEYVTIVGGTVSGAKIPANSKRQDRFCEEDFHLPGFVSSNLRPFVLHFHTGPMEIVPDLNKKRGFCLRWQQMEQL